MRDARRRWTRRLAALALASLAACSRQPAPLQLAGPAMGTTYSVSIPRLPDGVSRSSVEAAIAETLREADEHLSGWNAQSALARFNASEGTGWENVPTVLYEAVARAAAVSRSSGGAFDVTVGPLVRAWGFGAGANPGSARPSPTSIAQLLTHTGYAKLEWRASPPALRKTVPRVEIDLDGIAPGWAVDRIAERFEALGVVDYLVELGGELRARGSNPDGRRWRVAVETPVAGERRAHTIIEIDGAGVSTSGDYRDHREIDGRRVSHTIDPRTGMPVTHDLASVTVVHASAAEADAWATALMVLGPAQGMALAQREQLAVLFIRRDAADAAFVETMTPQFARLRATPVPGL